MTPVPGRTCGPCNVCCMEPYICDPALEKRPGILCPHCDPGVGCTIHATRPQTCRDHNCGWILMADCDETWRPDLSNIYIKLARELPPELATLFPRAEGSVVITLMGSLSTTHAAALTEKVAALIASGVPVYLVAAAPPDTVRKGLPLNPLLHPYLGDRAFADAFAVVLETCTKLPTAPFHPKEATF